MASQSLNTTRFALFWGRLLKASRSLGRRVRKRDAGLGEIERAFQRPHAIKDGFHVTAIADPSTFPNSVSRETISVQDMVRWE